MSLPGEGGWGGVAYAVWYECYQGVNVIAALQLHVMERTEDDDALKFSPLLLGCWVRGYVHLYYVGGGLWVLAKKKNSTFVLLILLIIMCRVQIKNHQDFKSYRKGLKLEFLPGEIKTAICID